MTDLFPLDDAIHSGLDSESVGGSGVWQGSLTFFSCLCTVFFSYLDFSFSQLCYLQTLSLVYMRKLGIHLKVNLVFVLQKWYGLFLEAVLKSSRFYADFILV